MADPTTRPLQMSCQQCGNERATRLAIDTNTADDVPIGENCLRALGIIGRPLPDTEYLPHHLTGGRFTIKMETKEETD